jgi:ribosomal protein S12 methylthiotransferase accessory factor
MDRFGITRVANITGLDVIGIPVFTAIRPCSRSLATSQGKGLDADAAKASALMESIETWHAEAIELPARWESAWGLRDRGVPAVEYEELPCLRAPNPVHPQPWVAGFDLLAERRCWVPVDAVTMNFVGVPERGTEMVRGSNGLASGNHPLEAIVHGLCEVIERDAEVLWRLDDDLVQVDLGSVRDPDCAEVLARLDASGVHVAAWDLTTDLGVPTYGCAVMEKPDRGRLRALGIHYGFGTHLAPEVALLRALTEAVQTRLTYIAGSRDDLLRHDYALGRNRDLLEQIWAEITAAPSAARLEDRPPLAGDTFETDTRLLLDRLVGAGVEQVVVVDLTRADLGIPVVKVVVPGLEGPGGNLPGRRARARMAAGRGGEGDRI